MKRIATYEFNAAISKAFETLTPRLKEMLRNTHFFLGADPVFAGLHEYELTHDGRSYRSECAHVVWPRNYKAGTPQSERVITVVIPKGKMKTSLSLDQVVVHELGHVLDYLTSECFSPEPVTQYAKHNRYEAFAEWFAAWHCEGYGGVKFSRKMLEWREPSELVRELTT